MKRVALHIWLNVLSLMIATTLPANIRILLERTESVVGIPDLILFLIGLSAGVWMYRQMYLFHTSENHHVRHHVLIRQLSPTFLFLGFQAGVLIYWQLREYQVDRVVASLMCVGALLLIWMPHVWVKQWLNAMHTNFIARSKQFGIPQTVLCLQPHLVILQLLSQENRWWYVLDLVKSSEGRLRRGSVYIYLDELVELNAIVERSDPDFQPNPTYPWLSPRHQFKISESGIRLLHENESKQLAPATL